MKRKHDSLLYMSDRIKSRVVQPVETTCNNPSEIHYEMMHNGNTRVTAIPLRQTLCSH